MALTIIRESISAQQMLTSLSGGLFPSANTSPDSDAPIHQVLRTPGQVMVASKLQFPALLDSFTKSLSLPRLNSLSKTTIEQMKALHTEMPFPELFSLFLDYALHETNRQLKTNSSSNDNARTLFEQFQSSINHLLYQPGRHLHKNNAYFFVNYEAVLNLLFRYLYTLRHIYKPG